MASNLPLVFFLDVDFTFSTTKKKKRGQPQQIEEQKVGGIEVGREDGG